MSHKAEQIVEATANAFRAFISKPVNVYEHRGMTLAEHQDELPAISVDFGEDAPFGADGASDFEFIQSILTVNATIIVTGADERDVRKDLLAFRTEVHRAIMQQSRLGLAGVMSVNYGGAEAPEILFEGDACLGALVCVWGVLYETDVNNPE